MTDPRLKTVRRRTLEAFRETLSQGADATEAIDLALDLHSQIARPYAPDIDRELDVLRDLMEREAPAPGLAPTTGRPADAKLPTTPPKAATPTIKETAMAPPPETDVPPELQRARKATIADYHRTLSRTSPAAARSEAMDLHIDRIECLDIDIDDEIEAMTALLEDLPTAPPPPPARTDRGGNRGPGQGRPTGRSAQGNKPRSALDPALLRSPFRFVPLADAVVDGATHDLDKPRPDGYCGTITVEWEAETPLLIGGPPAGDAKDKKIVGPMSLGDQEKGPFVIPGSTIRGYLRSTLDIVAAARLGRINEQSKFGLRDFDHPRIRPTNGELSLLDKKNVKAGFLRRRAPRSDEDPRLEAYEIYRCEWRTIAIADLPRAQGESDQYRWRAEWLRRDIPDRYATVYPKAVRTDGRQKFVDFREVTPQRFAETTEDNAVGELCAKKDGNILGIYVFSNKSPAAPSADVIKALEERNAPGQPKKREYVFLGDPRQARDEDWFPVPPKAWSRFLDINSRIHRNKHQPEGSWKALEPSLRQIGDVIPIFYIEDGDDLQIGLTRYFKVTHQYSVGDLRDREPAHRLSDARYPDFVDSLFGYVWEGENDPQPVADNVPAALKGRVAVGFAKAANAAPMTTVMETIMGAPRPSFAPFYLSGSVKDWSSTDSRTRLAGRKRYLPRTRPGTSMSDAANTLSATLKEQIDRIARETPTGVVAKDVKSHLKFLTAATKTAPLTFTGDLRLHNVTGTEIGGLLWALTHGGDPTKPYRHLMGRAKGLGAGQLRIRRLTLTLKPNDPNSVARKTAPEAWERPGPDGQEGWLTADSWSMAPFLRQFHDHMASWRQGWPHTLDMAEFLASADPALGANLAEQKRLDYPKLTEFRNIRDTVKLSTRHAPPATGRDRFLPVVPEPEAKKRARSMTLPYRMVAPSTTS